MDGIVSNVKRRVSLLKDTLRLVAEILAMIPERREVIKSRPELRHKEGYFDNGMIQRGAEKVFLMGPPLVDGPKYTKLTQCLADRLNQCGLQFHDTYNLPSEMIGEARLIKEPVWRACMEGLKMTLDWELQYVEAECERNDGLSEFASATGGVPVGDNSAAEAAGRSQNGDGAGSVQPETAMATRVPPNAETLVVHTFAEWQTLLSWSPTTWKRRRDEFPNCFTDVPGENSCSIGKSELDLWLASAKNKKQSPFKKP